MGEIRLALGAASTDTSLFPEADVMWALNAGLAKISTEREWPWLFVVAADATTATDDTLTLPADLSRLSYITVDGADLDEASARELGSSRSATGTPSLYAVEGDTIRVSPNPDGVYDVELGYYRHEPKITAGANVPLVPDAYSDWVVTAGAVKLAVRTNNTARLLELKAEYDGWLARAMDNSRRSAGVSRIRRTKPNVWPETY